LRVLHINFSKKGGAGSFANDLTSEQRSLGLDAHLVNLRSSDLWDEPLLDPLLTLEAAIDQYIFRSNNFESPISLARSGTRLEDDAPSSSPDLVHLHWIEGVVTSTWINRLKVPVVWTLHDFRPITGACHQPLNCDEISNACNSCPAVRSPFRPLVAKILQKRIQTGLFEKVEFVAPSSWVARGAERSTALRGSSVNVIHSASPIEIPTPETLAWVEALMSKNHEPMVVVAFGSSRSGLKGRASIERINRDIFKGYRVVTFGADSLSWADENVGLINRNQVTALLSRATLAVIPSLAETFSLTAFEATRSGTPVAGHPGGAIEEVASTFGVFVPLEEQAIRLFLAHRQSGPVRIVPRLMADVAHDYIDLYRRLLQRDST